jgi:exopolyphosphatase/guanosine-5'-triphosphate,3'-diphosphate pyrophosphatase
MNNIEGFSADKIVAYIDIGTNAARLLIGCLHENYSHSILHCEKEVVRLGEGGFMEQSLRPGAIDRTVSACRKFLDIAREWEAEEIYAIATSAAREAKNRQELLRKLWQETNLEVHIISGREQARLVYLGVSRNLDLEGKQTLFVDIGGGSTNLIVGDNDEYQYLEALKLGSVRLKTLFFLPEEIGPIPSPRYVLMQRYVRDVALRSIQTLRPLDLKQVIGSSGTISTLANVASYMFENRPYGNGDVLKYEQLEKILERLRSVSLYERQNIIGVEPERADIIVPGAVILHTLMQELSLPEITLSDKGLQDGMIIDSLSRLSGVHVGGGRISVREQSVLQLGRACSFEEGHARVVSGLALSLYDSARKIKLHRLGARERELLNFASLLHDIGAFVSQSNHHAHTYYLSKNAELLGFDQTEISIIAAVAYYHRKKPPKEKHVQLRVLDERSKEIVRILAVFLRIAESLDRSHTGLVKVANLMKMGEDIKLEIIAEEGCQLEIWGAQQHKKIFKKTFNRKFKIYTNVRSGA